MNAKKVLIADDSRNIVNLLKYNFEKKGYVVVESYDGEEAIKKAFSEKPDIIILDISMPLKDGFEVCKTLRDMPETYNVPIIILSARSKEFDKFTGFGLGADDYITKPFRPEDLIERVDFLLAGKRTPTRKGATVNDTKAAKEDQSGAALGEEHLDNLFKGKLFKGANILIVGGLGTGKSTICRKFLATGLKQGEGGLYLAVEDPPAMIEESLSVLLGQQLTQYSTDNLFRLVSVRDIKRGDLDAIVQSLAAAGDDIEQSIQKKKGGRRVIDSVSGLFLSYAEGDVYHLLTQVVHTASAFGGVTTLYTLEEGILTPQQTTTIKSFMDGVIELKNEQTGVFAMVEYMKWVDVPKEKIKLWNRL